MRTTLRRMTTPIWLIPAIAALLGAIPLVILLLKPYISKLTPEQRQAILGAVKGAKDVLGVIAPVTPTDIDDQIVAALKQVEAELGKSLTPEGKKLATNAFVSLIAKDHAGSDNKEMAAKLHAVATAPVKK